MKFIFYILFMFVITGCSTNKLAIHSYKGIQGKKYQPINFKQNTKNFKVVKYKPINFNNKNNTLKVIEYKPINFEQNTKNFKVVKYKPINFDNNRNNTLKVIKYKPINFDNNKNNTLKIVEYKSINFNKESIALLNEKRFKANKEARLTEKRKEVINSIILGIINIPNIITDIFYQPFNEAIDKKYQYINPNQEKGFYNEININSF